MLLLLLLLECTWLLWWSLLLLLPRVGLLWWHLLLPVLLPCWKQLRLLPSAAHIPCCPTRISCSSAWLKTWLLQAWLASSTAARQICTSCCTRPHACCCLKSGLTEPCTRTLHARCGLKPGLTEPHAGVRLQPWPSFETSLLQLKLLLQVVEVCW